MQMQNILFELAPKLLNGIEPRSVGRQRHDLDGQMPVSPFLPCLLAWLLRPVRSRVEREGNFLWFQSQQHIRVKMHRPIVLHHPDALRLWIGTSDLLIESDQFLDANFAGLPKEYATPLGV